MLLPCLFARGTVAVYPIEVVNNSSQPIHAAVKAPHLETYLAILSGDSKVLLELQQLNSRVHPDRKSTRLNSSHIPLSRMPSSA